MFDNSGRNDSVPILGPFRDSSPIRQVSEPATTTRGVAINDEESSSLHQKRNFDLFSEDHRPSASRASGAEDIWSRTLISDGTPSKINSREDVQTPSPGPPSRRIKQEHAWDLAITNSQRKLSMEIEFELNGLTMLHPSEFFSAPHSASRDVHQQDHAPSGNAVTKAGKNKRQTGNNGLNKLMEAFSQVVHAIKEYAPEINRGRVTSNSRELANSPNHPPPSETSQNEESRAFMLGSGEAPKNPSMQSIRTTVPSDRETRQDKCPLSPGPRTRSAIMMGASEYNNLQNPRKGPRPHVEALQRREISMAQTKNLMDVPEVRESAGPSHVPRAFSAIGTRSFYGGSPTPTFKSPFRPALSPLTPPNSSPLGSRPAPRCSPLEKPVPSNNDPSHMGTVSSLLAVVITPRPLSNGEKVSPQEFPPLESEYEPEPESDKEDNDSGCDTISSLAEVQMLHDVHPIEDYEGLERRRAAKPTLNEPDGRLAASITSTATRDRAQNVKLNYGPTDKELRCFPITNCPQTVTRVKVYPKYLRACDEHLLEAGKLPDPDDRHHEAPYCFGSSEGQLLAEYQYLTLRVGVNGDLAWSNRDIKRLLRKISYETAMDIEGLRRKIRKRLRRERRLRTP